MRRTRPFEADYEGKVVRTADGVTLDCAGHSIVGDGIGHRPGPTFSEQVISGIQLTDRTGVAINSCTIEEFEVGIDLLNSSGNVLSTNRIHRNEDVGIRLIDSHRNELSDNEVSDSGSIGIRLITSDESTFTRNTVSTSGLEGFKLESESNNNTLIDNESDGNRAESGFWLCESTGNTLSGNVASNNAALGFAIVGRSDFTVLSGNRATSNRYNGYTIDTAGNQVEGNTATSNGADGFNIAGPGSTWIDNASIDNATFGFFDHSSGTENSYSGNVCAGNTEGDSNRSDTCTA